MKAAVLNIATVVAALLMMASCSSWDRSEEAKERNRICIAALHPYAMAGTITRVFRDRSERLGCYVDLFLGDSTYQLQPPPDCDLFQYDEASNTLQLLVPHVQMGQGRERLAVGQRMTKAKDTDGFLLYDAQGAPLGELHLWNYTEGR